MISAGRPDSVGGGGVVAEIFRDPHKPARFSGEGGVVAEIFRDPHKPARFSGGGGGGSRNFSGSPITIRGNFFLPW